MLEDLAEGLMACDDRGNLLCANRIARKIFDKELPASGRIARELDANGEPFPLSRALSGESFSDREYFYAPGNLVLSCSGGPVKNEAGRMYGAVVTFRVLRPEEIGKVDSGSSEEQERVALLACHDLRAQFASIAILTKAAAYEEDEGTRQEYLREAGLIAEQSLDLVDDIFQVGDIKNEARAEVASQTFLLEDVANDIKRVCRPLAARKGIDLVFRDFTGQVRGSRRRIVQVLQNLVTNSIKFSMPDTSITVHARAKINRGVRIAVADEGIGMSKEQQRLVMTGSVKGRRDGTDGERSLGYGLYLVREILEYHGTTLRLTSRPGAGATFFFHLQHP